MEYLEKYKKTKLMIIGFSVLVIVLVGVTYAFFNYTRTGTDNALSTSTIEFNSTDDTLLNVATDFPQDADLSNEELIAMKTNHGGTLSISSYNTLTDGVKYSIYVIHGDDITGKTRLADSSIKFQLTPDFTSGEDGFTILTNNYSEPANLSFDNNGKALISTGLVKDTTELTTVDYNFYMWLDAGSMHVSSTMKRETLPEGNPSLADTTTGNVTSSRYLKNDGVLVNDVTLYPATSNEAGKIIYTTNEFSNGYYNIKIVVEAVDSPKPTPTPVPTPTPEPFVSTTYTNGCYTLTTLSNDTVKIDRYEYFYIDENSINQSCPDSNIIIPSSFDGKTVTTIGNNAFSNGEFSGTITIPNTVTTIGNNAFSNNNFSGTLTIPNTVTTIGNNAFANNNFSGTITIPNTVTTIGDYAFSNNNFSGTLTIPNSVTSIGDYAFMSNGGFTSVTIPNSVTSYGTESFGSEDCNDTIDSLSIDVSIIPINMFMNLEINSVTFGSHVTSIGNYAFQGNHLTSLTLPSGLVTIGEQAFCYNDLSGDLIIPNSVTTIDRAAFSDNGGFTSVSIPNSVTNLSAEAFNDTSIESLSIDVVNIPNSMFYGSGIESLTLGEHVVTIGEQAFYDNSISNITIPNSVTSVGEYAFDDNNLSSVTIPNSVTSIGVYSFGIAELHFNKSCSAISSMTDYDWGADGVYGSGNELCQ